MIADPRELLVAERLQNGADLPSHLVDQRQLVRHVAAGDDQAVARMSN
jgi:hypothetical protein